MKAFINSLRNRVFVFSPILLTIVFAIAMSSCQSREEKVISKIKSLTERIDKEGKKFTSEDWDNTFQKLQDINEEMEKCNFSQEEIRELGDIERRLTVIIMREGARSVGKGVSDYIRNAGAFLKGFENGSTNTMEEYEEEFEDVNEEIQSEIQDALDDISEMD